MANPSIQPRILFITPEVTFIPDNPRKHSDYIHYYSGGFTDFQADLIIKLFEMGVDVHLAQPDYRRIFGDISRNNRCPADKKIPADRVHLTEDRVFFYSNRSDLNYEWENIRISIAFQREVINYILPRVQPDLIHCHDWMTGLIPAMARDSGVPCIFTFQSHDTGKSQLSVIEDMGIDAAAFWQHLFFDRFPINYEETRETNPIDFLLSGIFAAHFVHTANSAFFKENARDQKSHLKTLLKQVFAKKMDAGCAAVYHNHRLNARIDLYESMLQRPVIKMNREKTYVFRPHISKRLSIP